MSTIVVVKKNGKAVIAADSLSTTGNVKIASKYDCYPEKIFTFGDNFIGFVGSAATQLAFESALKNYEKRIRFNSRESIFEALCYLHPILKERYFLNPKDEEDDPFESSHVEALIVNPNGIFGAYALRDVLEYQRFWAVGSGADFAIGAMYAVYDQLDAPEDIAKIGVAAGCEFDRNSAEPITMHTVTLHQK
jgi:ATP-dependent protease HslVU (ClpYQ) peptidase subunit